MHRHPHQIFDRGHGRQIDDRHDLACNVGEAEARRVQQARRPAKLVGAEVGEESLDRRAAVRCMQVAARGFTAVQFDRQRVVRVLVAGA
jgi:hypothetical protein